MLLVLVVSSGCGDDESPSGATAPTIAGERPFQVADDAVGYEVDGFRVWIELDGSAKVFDCGNRNPDDAIRAGGVPDYSGEWACY